MTEAASYEERAKAIFGDRADLYTTSFRGQILILRVSPRIALREFEILICRLSTSRATERITFSKRGRSHRSPPITWRLFQACETVKRLVLRYADVIRLSQDVGDCGASELLWYGSSFGQHLTNFRS